MGNLRNFQLLSCFGILWSVSRTALLSLNNIGFDSVQQHGSPLQGLDHFQSATTIQNVSKTESNNPNGEEASSDSKSLKMLNPNIPRRSKGTELFDRRETHLGKQTVAGRSLSDIVSDFRTGREGRELGPGNARLTDPNEAGSISPSIIDHRRDEQTGHSVRANISPRKISDRSLSDFAPVGSRSRRKRLEGKFIGSNRIKEFHRFKDLNYQSRWGVSPEVEIEQRDDDRNETTGEVDEGNSKRRRTSSYVSTSLDEQRTYQYGGTPQDEKAIMLVDIRSTGGEFLRMMTRLGCKSFRAKRVRESCLHDLQTPLAGQDLQVSKKTVNIMHLDQVFGRRMVPITTYLFTVRNPIDLISSWFDKMHPSNCNKRRGGVTSPDCRILGDFLESWLPHFFMECFSDVDSDAQSLQERLEQQPSTATTMAVGDGSDIVVQQVDRRCSEIALQVLRGEIEEANDLHFNYRYYMDRTVERFPNRDIMVIRSENLLDDLASVESELGGGDELGDILEDSTVLRQKVTTVMEESLVGVHEMTSVLSGTAKRLLCCAVEDEIVVYARLLERAINVNDASRNETLLSLWNNCGASSLDDLMKTCNVISPPGYFSDLQTKYSRRKRYG